jgi:hypothetical protein
VVDKDNPHLSSIIRINGTGSVKDCNSVLVSEPAPRTDLHLDSARKLYSNPRLDQTYPARRNIHFLYRCEICPNGLVRLVHRGFGGRM